jgi:enoyl-CoA hydratase/carnithine racemase
MIQKEISIPPFLNPQSIKDLTQQLLLAEKENTRFLLLKGSDTVFCNGLDLKWVTQNTTGNYLNDMQGYADFLKKLQTGSFISVAVVSGVASGGGMGIVCACDYVLATQTSTFSLPEGLLGLIPGMILPALLNRLSPQQIKKMVFTGQKYPSDIALQWGIADEVVKADEVQTSLAKVFGSMKSCKQEPIGTLKQILYNSHLTKDELAKQGMNILSAKLNEPEISERLRNLAEFMAD